MVVVVASDSSAEFATVPAAAAGDGDDFTNNDFSRLVPLLSSTSDGDAPAGDGGAGRVSLTNPFEAAAEYDMGFVGFVGCAGDALESLDGSALDSFPLEWAALAVVTAAAADDIEVDPDPDRAAAARIEAAMEVGSEG